MHPNDRIEAEARQAAIAAGLELITTRGVARLFDKNPDTVRSARKHGRIRVVFEMRNTEKRAPLYSLQSCIESWGSPDSGRLTKMRADAQTLWMANEGGNGGSLWAILHDGPFVQGVADEAVDAP